MTTTTIPAPDQVTGVILAGGRARRMAGRDKGLLECAGRPLIAHALDILRPVCGRLLINANRSLEDYRDFDVPVICDEVTGFQGPLAGILTALRVTDTPYLVVIPCDSPRLETVTLTRLLRALMENQVDIALAHDGKRLHPVVMALRTGLADDLAAYLNAGKRKVDRWVKRQAWATVDCSDRPGQFANINTPEELETLEKRLKEHSA